MSHVFFGMPFFFILHKIAEIGRSLAELCKKRFSRWRTSAILNSVLVIWLSSGSIYCSTPNFIEIGRLFTDILTIIVRHVVFSKLAVFVMLPLSGCHFASSCKISVKSNNLRMSYGLKSHFQYGGRLPSWILKILTFGHVTVIGINIWCTMLF